MTILELSLLSDEEVVAKVLAGDKPLYEVLMRRYNQRLYRIACSILRDRAEAEDVMQETYVRAYASLDQFAGKARFSTWLAKIAIYEAYERLRKRSRYRETPSSLDLDRKSETMEGFKSPNPDPEQQLLNAQASRLLERLIDALPDLYRPVFVLRIVENMSTTETAACLDLTEEAVKVRLLRARRRLRGELYARAGATSSQAFQFLSGRCDRMVGRVLAQIVSANPHS